jgi:hypothetical protein
MEDRDFVTRFVAFYLTDYREYKPDLDSFMNDGMAKIKQLSQEDITALKNDFEKAMHTAYAIFGDDAFRKRVQVGDSRKPINKALFEVLSVSFSKLLITECNKLIVAKERFKEELMRLMQPNSKFIESISHGTAAKENVVQRFRDIQQIIKDTLTDA